jgi:hypothetical protein
MLHVQQEFDRYCRAKDDLGSSYMQRVFGRCWWETGSCMFWPANLGLCRTMQLMLLLLLLPAAL